MTRSAATVLASTVLACVLAAGPLARAADKPPDFTRMIVKVGKKSVQATLGTHCVPTADGGGSCSEADYPLKTTGKVTIKARQHITLLFGAPAGDVSWRAARVTSKGVEVITAKGEARPVTKTKKRWRLTLPKSMRKSTKLLGFNVNYPNAFASFEVGASVR
jgi:hypothetical protein